MAKVVPMGAYVAARDRKLLLEILQLAQLAQALGRFDRRSFLESRRDQQLVAERLARIGELAGKVSERTKRGTQGVPWDDLGAARGEARDPAALWTTLKKVIPKLVGALAPLAAESELAAFTLAPPEKKAPATKPKPAKPHR